ncbi:MAG: hypothetical protein ACOCX5_00365 [Chloroflexota bacterium]
MRLIDESRFLSRLLQSVSNGLARRRGLPMVIGTLLVIVSIFVQSIDVFAENNVLELLGVLTLNGGVLIALIGLLLATPLGK